MSYITRNRKVLLNPAEKGRRYATQLKVGVVVETGEKLTKRQKAWRAGYLSARSDNAKAFKHNQRKWQRIRAHRRTY